MSNKTEKESEIWHVNLYGWKTIQPGAIHKIVAHTSMMPDADIRNMDMIHVITTYDDMQKRIFTGLCINYVNI